MITHGKKNSLVGIFVGFVVVLSCSLSFALVGGHEGGSWPGTWPKELEPYRNNAKTLMVATGIQEDVFEIYFKDRADFEKIWPILLTLKSKAAPLTLQSVETPLKEQEGKLFTNNQPMVRLYCPAYDGGTMTRTGKRLSSSPPWPESIIGPRGELPEYVTVSKDGDTWVPVSKDDAKGFMNRARIDIELVIDGKIIDLNRIRLPAETPIIDKRNLNEKDGRQP